MEQKQRLSQAAGVRRRTAKHILNGQWKLGKCIGQGSFGSVYTCLDSVTGKHIACKMMAIPTASVAPEGAPSRGPTKAESELRALCSEIELMRSLELTVRGTQALVSFAPLAFKLFYAARQNAVLRRSSFPPP